MLDTFLFCSVLQDALVLGAVGSNEWRGMLYEVKETVTGDSEMEIKDPSLNNNSYMGTSDCSSAGPGLVWEPLCASPCVCVSWCLDVF